MKTGSAAGSAKALPRQMVQVVSPGVTRGVVDPEAVFIPARAGQIDVGRGCPWSDREIQRREVRSKNPGR